MKPVAWLLPASLATAAVAATAAPAPAARIEHGRTLATLMGCRSCHGETLTGLPMVDDPDIGTLFSANLTRSVPAYTDRALERVIRTGVRPDGSHLWRMAAAPYAVLKPDDMRDLIAYLRSVPPAGAPTPRVVVGRRFLKAAMARRMQPESLTLAGDLAHPPADLGPRHARGRYLARTLGAGDQAPMGWNGRNTDGSPSPTGSAAVVTPTSVAPESHR